MPYARIVVSVFYRLLTFPFTSLSKLLLLIPKYVLTLFLVHRVIFFSQPSDLGLGFREF